MIPIKRGKKKKKKKLLLLHQEIMKLGWEQKKARKEEDHD